MDGLNERSAGSPFRIVPWNDDFLARIREFADSATHGRPGDAVIVFPLKRPKRYLVDIYRSGLSGPVLLPQIITPAQLVRMCLEGWRMPVLRQAGMLDQAALLRDSVLSLSESCSAGSPLARLADGIRKNGMVRFFPWGQRLAALLNECDAHMVDARNLEGLDGEVADHALAILENLGAIQRQYHERLKAAGLSTPGLDVRKAAEAAASRSGLPPRLSRKQVILAGFVRLTTAEDVLFRSLWTAGAHVCLHTDPALAEEGGTPHWSCGDHAEWLQRWNAGRELLGTPCTRSPELHFYAGYDLHSQLAELKKDLGIPAKDGERRAVVLSHDTILMPVLHYIPEKNINISLGYPLSRSMLARLVERMFQTREHMDAEGGATRRDLLALIRHPCVRMLRTEGSESCPEGKKLRPFLALLEGRLRNAGRTLDAVEAARDLADEVLGDLDHPPASEDICEETGLLLEHAVNVLAGKRRMSTLRDLAGLLADLAGLLLKNGASIWTSFPLDAECLSRLLSHIIPEMSGNAMADEALGTASLFGVARRSLAAERIPFEADPLTGLQVLGSLETRLLKFDTVHILDFTDDAIPGAASEDPLLPDGLRPLLGLPDGFRRDRLAAHTFRRLIAGAGTVRLYWQEGSGGGAVDGKKQRSRFTDELIWDLEQRKKALLVPGGDELRTASFPMSVVPEDRGAPAVRTPEIDEAVRSLLRSGITPSMLDDYLACPLLFLLRHACRIRPPQCAVDGDDPQGLGNALHKALRAAYAPFIGKPVHPGDITVEQMTGLFRQELEKAGIPGRLPAQSLFMLEYSVPKRLRDYLDRQPPVTRLINLEAEYSIDARQDGEPVRMKGVADRVDLREDGVHIIDYKTGRTSLGPAKGFWTNGAPWEAMASWEPGAPDPLPDLADRLPSAQLACYIHLFSSSGRKETAEAASDAIDAAWVQLADGGSEKSLFGNMTEEEKAGAVRTGIPLLLSFLLRHLLHSPQFSRRRSAKCRACPFRTSCGSPAD